MLKPLICLIAALLLTGCITTRVHTELIDPKGEVWTLTSKSDALVEIKRPDGTIFKVDNRGKSSFFEQYMQYVLIKAAPRVEQSTWGGLMK
jgi:hypothetical protein